MTNQLFPAWHFLLTCLAGWIDREQQQRLEYMQTELAVARGMLSKKRLRFNDDQRPKGRKSGRKDSSLEASPEFLHSTGLGSC